MSQWKDWFSSAETHSTESRYVIGAENTYSVCSAGVHASVFQPVEVLQAGAVKAGLMWGNHLPRNTCYWMRSHLYLQVTAIRFSEHQRNLNWLSLRSDVTTAVVGRMSSAWPSRPLSNIYIDHRYRYIEGCLPESRISFFAHFTGEAFKSVQCDVDLRKAWFINSVL